MFLCTPNIFKHIKNPIKSMVNVMRGYIYWGESGAIRPLLLE